MEIIFVFIAILGLFFIIFCFIATFSPKINSKFMKKQIKTIKNVVNETKDDIESISTDMADASKLGVQITANAIKKGFSNQIYCKHCGGSIDKDSNFCKFCGKEQ